MLIFCILKFPFSSLFLLLFMSYSSFLIGWELIFEKAAFIAVKFLNERLELDISFDFYSLHFSSKWSSKSDEFGSGSIEGVLCLVCAGYKIPYGVCSVNSKSFGAIIFISAYFFAIVAMKSIYLINDTPFDELSVLSISTGNQQIANL